MRVRELARVVTGLKSRQNVRMKVEERLKEFELIGRLDEWAWFKEMVFCLLAANFSALKAYEIVVELERSGLLVKGDKKEISSFLRSMGHRFYNLRANYIVRARERLNEVRKTIPELQDFDAREWLRKSILGFGMKESSHFLRNIGRKNLAIIDRHILRVMKKYGLIGEVRSLTRKRYILFEERLREIARLSDTSLAELDLYLWYFETGLVFR